MAEHDDDSKYKNVDDRLLDFDHDCQKVIQEISGLAARFFQLGMALGLKSSALEKIKSENPQNRDEALLAVIKMWLSRADIIWDKQSVIPSWKSLVIAVADSTGGGNPALAKRIADNHPAKTTKKEKQGAQGQGGRARSGSTPACPSPANKKKESEAGRARGASGSKSAESSPSSLKKEQAATAVGKKGASHSKLQGSTSAPLAKGSPAISPLVKQSSAASGHSELQMQAITTELFVTPPIDEAICKKCKNVAREPMHPSCCEKLAKCMLCKLCSEKSKCPHHKKTPECWVPDQILKTRISKWTIKCPNHLQCEEKFTVSKLDKHLAESQRCAKALSQRAMKGTPKSVPKRESH